jgi:membrane associated rhomboid family serine protease
LSVVCLFAYGGILKGILPTSTAISWESHVAVLVAGIVLAWIASKLNPVRKDLEGKPMGLGITTEK